MNVLKEMRKELNVPESEVSTYQSDLYIKHTKERYDWLKKNYEFFNNCELFSSAINGELTIDIPFANMEFWENNQ